MTNRAKLVAMGAGALFLALGCRDSGGEGRGDAQASAKESGIRGTSTVDGQVVSAKKDEVVLKQAGSEKELELAVDAATEVLIDGRKASAETLGEGAQVRASFTESGGTSKATRIEATTTAGGAASTGAGGTGAGRDEGAKPGEAPGTVGGLGGASSRTPGQAGAPGGENATSASQDRQDGEQKTGDEAGKK